MKDKNPFLPLVQQFLEHDIATGARFIENMPEEEAADIIRTLPTALATRVIRQLQVSYAAALIKDADESFLQELTTHLDPQLV